MKFKSLIALGFFVFSSAYATEPRQNHFKDCGELLDFYQNKLGHDLANELYSAHGNKKLGVLLSIPKNQLSTEHETPTPFSAAFIASFLQKDGIQSVDIQKLDSGPYILVVGRKSAILELMNDFHAQGNKLHGVELEWAGLKSDLTARNTNDAQPAKNVDMDLLAKHKAELKDKIRNISGYVGIGIGTVQKEVGIRIYVETEESIKNFDEALKDLPVPFEVIVSGTIQFQ